MAKSVQIQPDGLALYNDTSGRTTVNANPDGSNVNLLLPTTSGTLVVEGGDGLLPTGGTASQVLAKASGADYDTEWVAASGGGGGNFELVMVATADTTVTSSITLVDATGMSVALEASSTYLMNGLLFLSSGTFSGGLTVAFTPVSGWTGYAAWTGNNAVSNATNAFSLTAVGTSSAPNPIALLRGVVVTTSAGTLQFQFAQLSSNATGTTIAQGSFIQLRKIS